jgi:hypothetical protein
LPNGAECFHHLERVYQWRLILLLGKGTLPEREGKPGSNESEFDLRSRFESCEDSSGKPLIDDWCAHLPPKVLTQAACRTQIRSKEYKGASHLPATATKHQGLILCFQSESAEKGKARARDYTSLS